jgi:hypothetical protein
MSEELMAIIKRAQAAYEALSPIEKARHNYDQRRSYIRGEMGIEHPEMSDEELDRIVDEGFIRMGVVRP